MVGILRPFGEQLQKYHKVVQLKLEFNKEIPEKNKTEFDKSLLRALDYNPNKEKEPSK